MWSRSAIGTALLGLAAVGAILGPDVVDDLREAPPAGAVAARSADQPDDAPDNAPDPGAGEDLLPLEAPVPTHLAHLATTAAELTEQLQGAGIACTVSNPSPFEAPGMTTFFTWDCGAGAAPLRFTLFTTAEDLAEWYDGGAEWVDPAQSAGARTQPGAFAIEERLLGGFVMADTYSGDDSPEAAALISRIESALRP